MARESRQDRRRRRAQRIREGGRRQFIWKYGVLGWGLPTAIVFAAAMAWWGGIEHPWLMLAISLVLFPLGGIWWGAWMWKILARSWERESPEGGSTDS